MTFCVLIRGPLGVGKSTIGKRLAQVIGGVYFSVDDTLHDLQLDRVEGECIPARNFIRATEYVLPIATRALMTGTPVVFDGNFYHQEQIDHLLAHISVPVVAFTLHAPLEACASRDAGRTRPHGPGAAAAVYSLVARILYGTVVETGGKSVDAVLDEIQRQLPKK